MKSFLVGLSVGVGVGLLLAPAEGSETRRQLGEIAEEWKELPRRKMEEKVQEAREHAGELGRKAGEEAFDEVERRVVGEKWP